MDELKSMKFFCPKCGSITHFHQWKERSAWSCDSLVPRINQLQVLCQNKECNRTHVVLPDFLNPYKRYVGAEIEAAVEQKQDDPSGIAPSTDADESTINRWNAQYLKRVDIIIQVLLRMLIGMGIMENLVEQVEGYKRLKKILTLFPKREYATYMGYSNTKMYEHGSLEYF